MAGASAAPLAESLDFDYRPAPCCGAQGPRPERAAPAQPASLPPAPRM